MSLMRDGNCVDRAHRRVWEGICIAYILICFDILVIVLWIKSPRELYYANCYIHIKIESYRSKGSVSRE